MATNKNFEIKNGLTIAGTERISSDGAFTGSLASATTATTQSAADSSTKIATTAYTDAAITAVIGGAPGTLDTLNELAAAINDDASYASTLTTALATKAPLASPTFTGTLEIPNLTISSAQGSDGQVLTSTGSGIAWEAVPAGTTINNNAVNRIITGSNTADTLEGESGLTYDGSTLAVYANTAGFNESLILEQANNSSIYSRGSAITYQVSNGSVIKDAAYIKGGRESTTSGGYLYFDTADSSWNAPVERMRIDSAGNVGIGTDAPGAKLEIKDGNLWLNGASSGYNPEIFFIDDAGPTGIAGVKIRYGNSDGNLYFDHKWDNAGSGFFFRNRVDGTALNTMALVNGNVGFGTTDPLRSLDSRHALNIFGSGGYTELMLRGRAGTAQNLGAWHWSIRADVGGNNDDLMLLRFTGGNSPSYAGIAMQIANATGYVGIGTDSPAVSLDVGSKTDAIRIPNGTTAQRPTGALGQIRYNTTNSKLEGYIGGQWANIATTDNYPVTTNLYARYTGDSYVYNGSSTPSWNDTSGNGRNINATSTSTGDGFWARSSSTWPTIVSNSGNGADNTFNCIQFDKTEALALPDDTSISAYASTGWTFAYVARYASSSSADRERLMAGKGSNNLLGFWGGARGVFFDGGWLVGPSTQHSIDVTDWTIIIIQHDVGMSKTKDNNSGNFVTSTFAHNYTNANYSATGARYGFNYHDHGIGGGGGEESVFEIAEWAMFDRKLTTTEMTSIGSFLETKYGI